MLKRIALALLMLTPAFAQRPALVSPVIRFSDANGKPLTGGYLYSYQAGTTTPLATYVDSTTSALNTNPVVLDSTGSARVFLGPNVYKLVLQNSAHVEQWNADNIAQGMFQSGNLVTSVFGRTGAVVAKTGDYACAQITGAICSVTPQTLYYQKVQTSGSLAPQEPILNFIPGVSGSIFTFSASGGTGYTGAPSVTFTGGGCSVEPTGSVAVSGGEVTNPTITTAGSGCTTPPTPNFSGGGGTGATGSTSLTPNGVSCVDNPAHTSTDCTFTVSPVGGGGGSSCVLTDVTSSRNLNATYQNTTNSVMYISGAGNTSGSSVGYLNVLEGVSSADTRVYGDSATATIDAGEVGFFAAILPGYFYSVTGGGAVNGIQHMAEVTECGGATTGGGLTSFSAPSGSWPSWLVPAVTNPTTAPSLAVTASVLPNSALANPATTVNGVTCTLGSTCTVATGSGSLSGQVAGYAVEAATATTATGPFPIDDAITTTGTLTAHKPVAVNDGTGGAGYFGVHAGTAQGTLANTIGLAGPTSVTAYNLVLPGTAPTSTLKYLNCAAAPCVWDAGGAASAAFSGLTSGTNTAAAMLVGTGASLAPTGSGTITPSAVNLAASGNGGVTGLLPNANLANPATTVNGTTCTLGSTCTVSSGGSNAVQSFPAFNDATGTSVNTLASWMPGVKPGTIHTTPTSGSNGTDSSPSIVGVVIAGAGTSGLATVQYAGSVQWICDDQTIVGDQVQPSISTAGYCHDPGGGSTAQQVNENPESNSFLGRVTVANTGSGTASTITLYQYTGYGTVGNIGNQYGSSLFTLQQGQGSPYLTSSWWAQENSTHALVGGTPIKLGLTSTGFYYDMEGPNSGVGINSTDWLFDIITHGPGQGGNSPGSMIRFNGSTYNVPYVQSVSGTIFAGSGGSSGGYYPGETTGNFIFTLTGNATFPNPTTTEANGHILTFDIKQAPSGGPYTFSWGTSYKNAPSMCTTASCSMTVQFISDGTNYQCLTGCASGTYTGTTPIVVSGTAISCPTCSVGSGTNVTINGGSSLGTANLNSTTPAAPGGNTNVTFQQSSNNVSGYIPNPTTCTLCMVNITGSVTPTGCTVSGNQCVVGSAVGTVTLASIPGTYSHIKIVATYGTADVAATNVDFQLNGDTASHYLFQQLYSSGTATPGGGGNGGSLSGHGQFGPTAGSAAGSAPSGVDFTIPFYANTTFYKSTIADATRWNTSTSNLIQNYDSLWESTAAVTSISIFSEGAANIVSGSIFTIYGIP